MINKISRRAIDVLLQDAVQRDLTTARRFILLQILWNERYLTRAQLIARVEYRLGRNCFGPAAWEDTFYRDMRMVKQAFQAAGHILDTMMEDRADIPLNAIHIYSGLKADLYLLREGDALRQSAFQRRLLVDYGPPIGEVYIHSPEDLIHYKLMYLGLSGQPKHARDDEKLSLGERDV